VRGGFTRGISTGREMKRVIIAGIVISVLVWLIIPSDYGGGGFLESSPLVYITPVSPTRTINNTRYYTGTPSYKYTFDFDQYGKKQSCGSEPSSPVSWIAVFGDHTLEATFQPIYYYGVESGWRCADSREEMQVKLILSSLTYDGEPIDASAELETDQKRYWKNLLGIELPRYFSSNQRDPYKVCKDLADSGIIEESDRQACETREEGPVKSVIVKADDFLLELRLKYTGGAYYWEDGYYELTFYVPDYLIESPTPYCGDGVCSGTETCETCPEDCGECPPTPYCGDGVCSGTETCETCPEDCGECPAEPYCGDGVCSGTETCETCPEDCGECPAEPYCGDGVCGGDETCETCPEDCGECPAEPYCGDGVCGEGENYENCPQDCDGGGGGESIQIWLIIGVLIILIGIVSILILKNG